MEWMDIVDEQGRPTGKTVDREMAHQEGIPHRTSHLWLLRRRNGKVQVLLQKRSLTKDSHPGCYDISSAGHIPAGMDFLTSALRELEEELGLEADAGELILCGTRRIRYAGEFHGRPFRDNQVSRVYALWWDVEPEALVLQAEEVESVLWMDYDRCCQAVKENSFPHCIVPEELELLRKAWD